MVKKQQRGSWWYTGAVQRTTDKTEEEKRIYKNTKAKQRERKEVGMLL